MMIRVRLARPGGLGADISEPSVRHLLSDLSGLGWGEAMGGVTTGAGPGHSFGDEEAAAGCQHPVRLREPGDVIGPVVGRTESPHDRGAVVRQRKIFGVSLEPGNVAGPAPGADPPGQGQAGGIRIHAGRCGRLAGGFTGGRAGAAAHIHHAVVTGEPGEPGHGPGGGGTPRERHGYCGEPLNGTAGLPAYATLDWLRCGTGHRYPSFPQRPPREPVSHGYPDPRQASSPSWIRRLGSSLNSFASK